MKLRYILLLGLAAWAYYTFSMERVPKKQKVEGQVTQKSIADILKTAPEVIQKRYKISGDQIVLDLSALGITSLEGLEMVPHYTQITNLSLVGNYLTSIPNDAFYGMKNLQKLDLFFNEIRTIEPLAFKGLSMLQELDLSDNKLKQVGVFLANLDNLRVLNLENNNISSIAPNAFRDLKNAVDVSLENNTLKTINLDSLIYKVEGTTRADGLVKLEVLNLEGNQLSDEDQERITQHIHRYTPHTTIIF